MTRFLLSLGLILVLTGCSGLSDRIGGGLFGQRSNAPETPEPAPAQEPLDATDGNAVAQTGTMTADTLDTTTEAERAEAMATPTGGEQALGTTIASLGAVAEGGIWLKTPLVQAEGKGRVESPETGKSVAVDLIPLGGEPGAGSRLSLAAMRLLEVDLTSLPEVRVFRSN